MRIQGVDSLTDALSVMLDDFEQSGHVTTLASYDGQTLVATPNVSLAAEWYEVGPAWGHGNPAHEQYRTRGFAHPLHLQLEVLGSIERGETYDTIGQILAEFCS